MDLKEAERVVVAKPVASRPTYSGFRSFSELLVGAINAAAPPNIRPESAVAAIRPKTVRVNSTINCAQAGLNSSQTEMLCTENDHSADKASDYKPVVLYKPLAKFVSKATVSLLANMGNFSAHNQQPLPTVEAHIHHQDQNNYQQNIQIQTQTHQSKEASKIASEDDVKSMVPGNSDRQASYDGYNWRKYGQKQVKGSEYPRSYYKCTHPNCPVKKKVERSLDGQIAEIVYKGEHNHSKPRPPKHNPSGTRGSNLQITNDLPWANSMDERTVGVQGRLENNQIEAGFGAHYHDPDLNQGGGTPDNSCGMSGECAERRKSIKVDENESRSKKRKVEKQSSEASALPCDAVLEPRIVVQNSTDSEIVGDGFRWRKYGQKVVKGNPYPRSYYRCTSLKCNVRKHVERASDDPRAFITTYEGKHNHEMPLKNKNPAASESESQANTSKDRS